MLGFRRKRTNLHEKYDYLGEGMLNTERGTFNCRPYWLTLKSSRDRRKNGVIRVR